MRVAGGRVSLCWSSANRDEEVFDAPEEVRLDRKPNPHIAFGFRAHLCLGALHMRVIMRQFLEGELEVEFNPQGTLAERMRAGGGDGQTSTTCHPRWHYRDRRATKNPIIHSTFHIRVRVLLTS